MTNLVKVELSKRQLRFTPDSEPTVDSELEIVVKNNSNQFASFQLELLAPGADPNSELKWYTVEPKVSVKKPPGQSTNFRIRIIKAPLRAYDTTIHLLLKVLSVESEALATEEPLSLEIKKPQRSLKLYLPNKTPSVTPGDRIEIPVIVYNLSPRYSHITLTCTDLDPSWLDPQAEQTVSLDAGDSAQISFWCEPPADLATLSQPYEFRIEAKSDTSPYTTLESGTLHVLPWGTVDFTYSPPHYQKPTRKDGLIRSTHPMVYPLIFTNYSNLSHRIELEIAERERQQCKLQLPDRLDELEPGEMRPLSLLSYKRPPWIGLPQRLLFKVFPALYDPDSDQPHSTIRVNPAVHLFELVVRPRIPVLLQVLIGLLGLFLLAWLWWLNPAQPQIGTVHSVRLIANGNMVVTGSADHTIRSWQVDRTPWQIGARRLQEAGKLAEDAGDAVRVIRQIPTHEQEIAAGLENGQIKLWDVPSKRLLKTLLYKNQKGDRVFDLDFTRDSRYLFSVHGSGKVYQWDMSQTPDQIMAPRQQAYPRFAISALAVSEELGNSAGRTLVILGGRYNKLAVWDLAENRMYQLPYTNNEASPSFKPINGQLHYITSLAIADDNQLLVSGDNQGYTRVWDMARIRQCVIQQASNAQQTGSVQPNGNVRLPLPILNCGNLVRDQWQDGHDQQAVRSVALSQDSTYLTSVGDDGRVMLWCLSNTGERSPNQSRGEKIDQFSDTRLNSVDIKALDDAILVASDADQNRVRLFRINRERNNANCQQ
jgi:WD40 repeat protein